MHKKHKLYLIIAILSSISLIIAIILKLKGVNWFNLEISVIYVPIILKHILNATMLILQFYLIIGIITQLAPKELFFKILPFIPLNILLYFIPGNVYVFLNIIILVVSSIAIKPKGKTLINLVIAIPLISIVQITIIWLRTNIFELSPLFPDVIKMLLMNIDQFVILFLLYYLSRKWGEKYAFMVISRRKR